ncbi:Dipeptidyl-peptidase 5 [bacterium HR36]|nr:Dipeptidyl-peptidase 5 [bacterium HR36]
MKCAVPLIIWSAWLVSFLFGTILALCAPTNSPPEQQLTFDGKWKADPAVLPNGQEIVHTLQETPTLLSLWRLSLATGKSERLHPEATTNEFEIAFSPDGRVAAFVQNRANLNLKLIIRDYQEKRDYIYDPGGGFAGMRSPAISPDLRRVLFSIPTATGQQIAYVNLQGQNRQFLTHSPGVNNWPRVSPDGKQIVFASSRDGDYEIYIMDAQGENVRRLTRSPGMDIRPVWSPDGQLIAFTSNRDGNYEIYVMNADGSHLRRLTNHSGRDDYPWWFPDGQHLVYVSERHGRYDLYKMPVPR